MNSVLIITSVITSVAVLIYTAFAGMQWWAIKKQGMYSSEQVAKMQGQLDTMQAQAKTMEESLSQTRALVAISETQMKASMLAAQAAERSAKAAEDGVASAQENTIHAQRAYVCVTKASMQDGNLFSLFIENAGNTLANEVQIVCRAEVRERDPDPKLQAYSPEQHFSAIGVIAPHSHFQKLKAIDGKFGGDEQRKMQAGWKLYCYGKILYKDVFDNGRMTCFCFAQRWNSQFLGPALDGNSAD